MKPITHLLGNKVVAQRYLWFAEKKLAELKMVMGLQNLEFGQRMYRLPNNRVEVYVESSLGFDKIRIAAARVRAPNNVEFTLPMLEVDATACDDKLDFSASVLSGSAPLTVAFEEISSPGCWDQQAWQMGDGTMYRGRAPSHTYQEPGTYTVGLKAWKSNPDRPNGQFMGMTQSNVETKTGSSGVSPEEAHADFLATSWGTTSPVPRGGFHYYLRNEGGVYFYFGERRTLEVDVVETEGDDRYVPIMYVQFVKVQFNLPTTSESGCLFDTFTEKKYGQSFTFRIPFADLSPFKGTTISRRMVDLTDYAPLSLPPVNETQGWWATSDVNAQLFWYTRIREIEKVNFITVT